MRKQRMKWAGALLMAVMIATLSACGDQRSATDGTSKGSITGEAGNENKLTTISMYPADANISSGVITGHKAEYFAENGIELEVWAYSDEKTNAILASGDMPDIMYVSYENLDTMIEAGMLLNLDEYLDQMPHVQSYEPMEQALNYVKKFRSAGTGSVYGLPLSVGESSTKVSWTDSTDRNAVKLRWDIYEEIGAPEIKNMDDLIDVMEMMVKAHPTDEKGTPFYGTILNSGSDTNYFACMVMYYRWLGYDESQLAYLLETDMINGTCSSILDKNSKYYEGLKWYNEVYRRGLMDPDSINNDRATQKAKVDAGYAMIPSGYLPGWAPGYLEYYIPGTKLYYSYNGAYGDGKRLIAINANTEHLDACLKLLDMWCDPDAYFRIINGRDGDFWYSDGENAFLTEENIEYLKEHRGSEQNRTYPDGEEAILWNTSFCVNTGAENSWKDGKGNHRIGRTSQWEEVMSITTDNATFNSWKETTGYDNWRDWLDAENAFKSESDMDNVSNFCSQPDDSMKLTLDAVRDVVVNSSWKMVYAESDEQFEQIWDTMVNDCNGLGAEQLIEWRLNDIENAKKIRDDLK